MKIFTPICPYCGKRTILAAPNRKSLGARYGRNVQGINYYCGSRPKLLPYTIHRSSSYVDCGKPPYTIDLTHYYTYIKKYHIVIIHDMINMLNRFKVHEMFNPKYAFRCKHCDGKLSINYNPFAPFYTFFFILPFLIVLTIALVSVTNVIMISINGQNGELSKEIDKIVVCSIVLSVLSIVGGLYVGIGYASVKKYFSNIVPTGLFDDYIVPHCDVKFKKENLKKRYCHRGNIFSAELDDEEICFYVAEKRKTLSCRICGTDDERRRIADKLKKNLRKNINLFFEDKSVGAAEILDVFDIPTEKPKTFYKPDIIDED